MDKIGADFFNCVHMIKDRTGAIPAPIQLPIGAETELEGHVDLVTMKEWVWEGEDLGASWVVREIRDSLKEKAEQMRAELIEIAVEMDDAAMEAYLKQGLETSASDQAYAELEASTLDAVDGSIAAGAADRVSTTNLQEGDVDEADTIKTDGSHLFMLRNCATKTCLVTYELDGSAATASELSSLELTTT